MVWCDDDIFIVAYSRICFPFGRAQVANFAFLAVKTFHDAVEGRSLDADWLSQARTARRALRGMPSELSDAYESFNSLDKRGFGRVQWGDVKSVSFFEERLEGVSLPDSSRVRMTDLLRLYLLRSEEGARPAYAHLLLEHLDKVQISVCVFSVLRLQCFPQFLTTLCKNGHSLIKK